MRITKYDFKVNGITVKTNIKSPLACGRDSILKLEQALLSFKDADTTGGDVKHHFSEGLYARELFIPAGTVLVGHIHLQGQINFLLKGTIEVTTDEGVKELTAPQIVVTGPGTKRAGHAITDTIWVTVIATDETDLDIMADKVLAKGFEDPRLLAKEILCLGQQ